jgi:hypothetical protein
VWWHSAAYLGLFADDHGLQNTGVAEPKGGSDGGIAGGKGYTAEGGRKLVEVVADLVDGTVFGFCQRARLVKGVCSGVSTKILDF